MSRAFLQSFAIATLLRKVRISLQSVPTPLPVDSTSSTAERAEGASPSNMKFTIFATDEKSAAPRTAFTSS